jgi:pathogenesis-related protein 1
VGLRRLGMGAAFRISSFLVAVSSALAQSHSVSTEMLQAHNSVRHSVGVPPLTWSHELAAHAQEWADALLKSGQLSHTPKSAYGENLFEITGEPASPPQVVNEWAAESKNYNYTSNRCNGTCGHYTQIVWRDTKEVGCGVARGAQREVWVCEYNPPGNLIGKRPY